MLLFSMFLCFLIADCNAASTIANHANVNTGHDSFVGPRYGMSDYAPGNSSLASNGSPQTANSQPVPGYVAVGGVGPAESAIALHKGQVHPPRATHSVQLTTNLDAGAPAGGAPLSTPVTVYDSLGTAHVLNFNFSKSAAGTWSCDITIPNVDVTAPPAWATSTAYSVGQMVSSQLSNGHFYRCTVAGTSSLTAPSEWPTDGSSFADGIVTWQDMGTQTNLKTVGLSFDSSGKLTSPAGNVSGITASGLADGAYLKFQWNLYSSTGAPLLNQVPASSLMSGTPESGPICLLSSENTFMKYPQSALPRSNRLPARPASCCTGVAPSPLNRRDSTQRNFCSCPILLSAHGNLLAPSTGACAESRSPST